MTRPLIGVTGRRLPLSQIADVPAILRTARAQLHLDDYARGIAVAGGIPVQLSFRTDPAVLSRLDGLVLSGGGDIDPARYARPRRTTDVDIDPGRDAHELALFEAARELEVPVLGICRGLQLINVAHGGSLLADLPLGCGERHASFEDPRDARIVTVDTVPGTRTAELYGARTRVNCLHHQAVDRVGSELVVAARAVDGVIEALELPGADVLAVQWHPEMFAGSDPCFHWLVSAAGALTCNHRLVARLA